MMVPRPERTDRPVLAEGEQWVWDYPRPPSLEPVRQRVEVWVGSRKIVDTTSAHRVCETSHPPTYYLPPEDVAMDSFEPAGGGSFCEWKGSARYWTYRDDHETLERVAWSYPNPTDTFVPIAGHLAMYIRGSMRATVGGLAATPQPGGFYGGWVTPNLHGPFKGEPGTLHW